MLNVFHLTEHTDFWGDSSNIFSGDNLFALFLEGEADSVIFIKNDFLPGEGVYDGDSIISCLSDSTWSSYSYSEVAGALFFSAFSTTIVEWYIDSFSSSTLWITA